MSETRAPYAAATAPLPDTEGLLPDSYSAAPFVVGRPLPTAPAYTLPSEAAQASWGEDRLQQECLLWLQHHHPTAARLIYHVPNGGKRSAKQASDFQKMGVRAGVPDFCLPMQGNMDTTAWPSSCLYIELKTAKGRVAPEQTAYHALLRQAGNRVEVIRSLPDFITLLTEYLA